MNYNYYEPRYIIKSDKEKIDFYFNSSNNSKTLEDTIFEFDKIVLLGNPGIGKSTELEKLFDSLWDKIDGNGIVPFSINLKNFRKINNFEDLLIFKDWQSLSQIIFILDGLDEISEIEDFLSAFETFINKNKLSNYKYVISCRTNIFEKYLVNIPDFETFYLEDLSIGQSITLLKEKFAIKLDYSTILERHYQYLKTPFFLTLFAEYYNSENKLPDSDAIMWQIYVNKHLEIQKNKVKKKKVLNIPQEIKELKKIAFINEFQHKNFITDEELNEVIGPNYMQLIENPFLVNLENENNKFAFEHRQLQEYFVAKTLSEKKFEEILLIIKIGNLNKVHPTLFNSISFLINLLDDNEQRNKLIDWIEKNQIELLIRADSDRIDENLKIRVFQNYFDYVCIKKSHWITTDRSFSVTEIARFGDNEANFNYLISIIDDKELIFRARISALDLISHFNKVFPVKLEYFSSFLIKSLEDNENSNQIKSAILHCILILKICSNDKNYFLKILDIFKNETSKEINAEILNLMNDLTFIDSHSDYIMEEFLRENNIQLRTDKDDVIRGNSYTLNQLILKIKDSNIFIDFAKYFLDSQYSIDVYSNDLDKLIDKCLKYEQTEDDFMLRLFKKLDIKKQHFYLEQPMRKLISSLSKDSVGIVFQYLLDNFNFKDINYLLASLADDVNINYVIKRFIEKNDLDYKEIEYFRNIVSNNEKQNLARKFNDELVIAGFNFEKDLFSDSEIELIREGIKKKPQLNFDLLFKKKKLTGEVLGFFEKNENEIDKTKYYEMQKQWYDKNGHGNIIDISLKILSKVLNKFSGSINFNEFEEVLNDNDFLFYEIKSQLEYDKNKSLIISQIQIEYIENWVSKKVDEINFKNVYTPNSNGFTLLGDYIKWKHVIYFSRRLNLNLPIQFLLNSLIIPETGNYNEDNESLFNFLRDKINNEDLFNSQVISNLKIDSIPTFIFDKHIDYVIEKKLHSAFADVRRYLLDRESEYNIKNKLVNYYKLEKDVDLLKECAHEIDSFKSWEAIEILMEENIERDFCFHKSVKYLQDVENNSKRFISNALNVLFKLNSVEAVKFYHDFLSIELYASAYLKAFVNYTAIENYEILENFFFKIYGRGLVERSFSSAANFLSQYISNLSKVDESYRKTQLILSQILSKLKKGIDDSQIFQINLLIDISNNSYYNSKSKPLTFKDALSLVNQII